MKNASAQSKLTAHVSVHGNSSPFCIRYNALNVKQGQHTHIIREAYHIIMTENCIGHASLTLAALTKKGKYVEGSPFLLQGL